MEGRPLDHRADPGEIGRGIADGVPEHETVALAGPDQPEKHSQSGRLAGSVGPDEARQCPGGDVQVQPVH